MEVRKILQLRISVFGVKVHKFNKVLTLDDF